MIHIEQEIKILKEELFQMWVLVNSQIEKSRLSLINHDKNLAKDIRANEKRVDAYELKLDMDCERILLLLSPVAVDLRFIIAILKMNYNLERIGDYANQIAKIVESQEGKFHEKILEGLKVPEIYFSVQTMLAEGIEAFQADEKDKMLGLFEKDEKLDKLHADATISAVELGKKNPDKLDQIFKVLTSVKMLERAGDHLLNIVEEYIFYLDAKIIKHSKLQPGQG